MRRWTGWGIAAVLTIVAGCGGGGSSGTAAPAENNLTCGSVVNPGLPPIACAGGTASNGGSGAVAGSTVALSLTDASGTATNQVTPDAAATLTATVRDARGAAVPNVAVTFTTDDDSGSFVPSSGTALTDGGGVARVGIRAGRKAGAYTARAAAPVDGATAAASVSYAVAFPTLALGAPVVTPSTLSAGGNASVSVTVLRGNAPYQPPLPVTFTSPCVAAGKAAIGSPVLSQAGVATASYSDKGCGVPDVLTASVTLGDAVATSSGTINVLPASVGSVNFVSADTTNIALRGTGGFGRQEYSTVKFRVADSTGNPVAGKLVDFTFADSGTAATIGGLTLNPTFATSAADGTVTTLVSGGTIPTSSRVVATVRGSAPSITSLSNLLVASTGVPDQRHLSLSTAIGNCEGLQFDQECSIVTASMGDHFGNPVPDGTAINFSAEGGVIEASCITGTAPAGGATPGGQSTNVKVGPGSGACSVKLRSSSPRPANGRITVLAYALGEEDFTDNNGNNVFDAGDTYADKSPDIYRDDDENFAWAPGEACVGPNANGRCTTPGDGVYNGVLRIPQVPSPQTLYVSSQLVQVFSGSRADIGFDAASYTCPANGLVRIVATFKDQIGNVLPAGTDISFSIFPPEIPWAVTPTNVKVPNIVLAVGEAMPVLSYDVTVRCPPGGAGQLTARVTTPNGIISLKDVPIR